MYLGMTKEDFNSVYDQTPLLVGERVGLSVEGLKEDDLLSGIKEKDAIAFEIMKEFRSTYREWWDLSKTLTLESTAFSKLKREKIQTLIFKRDEIRKALVSYLNSKYGKLNA